MVGEFLGKAVDVEAAHAGDGFAEVVAALLAGAADAAGDGAEGDDALAGAEVGDAFADGGDFSGGFGGDGEREAALGEGHTPKTPDVEVVEADGADADLRLAGGGRGGVGEIDDADVAVAEKLDGTHALVLGGRGEAVRRAGADGKLGWGGLLF